MKNQMRILQGLKLAAVLAVALSMGACANKNVGTDAMASTATPGSQQDFVVMSATASSSKATRPI
jgi:peptidoglycan-associated lipoprotein